MIEKVFNELSPYLRGIKKADSYSIVEVDLPKTWLIPKHGSIENQTKETKDRNMYYMFFSEKDSFDKIIDWLSSDVIDMNLEIEQKEQLLKEKVEQLKEVFENSSLDELKNLNFSSDSDVLKLGASKNNTEKNGKKSEKSEEPEKIES